MIYIYGLWCPMEREIRYIGKSVVPERRLSAHVAGARRGAYNHHTARWLRKLFAAGLKPTLVVLRAVEAGERWQEIERQAIADARAAGVRLTNSTAGGEGLDYVDPEARAAYLENLSRSLKALWSEPERREQQKARSKNAWRDPDMRARRSASLSAANSKQETQARRSAASAEIGARPEVRAAKSSAQQENWQKEAYRSAVVAARNDPAFTEAQAKRLKERWVDPSHRDKMQAARWTDEKRREQAARLASPDRAEKIAKALANPDLIARRNASIKAAWARRKANAAGSR